MAQSIANGAGTNTTGLNQLTDHVIASDLMMNATTAVKMYALVMTQAATPAVRTMLKKQLDQAITFQEQVGNYMADRGWYVSDMDAQLKTDVKRAQETISLLK